MSETSRIAVLLNLIDTMDGKGSWCGETHIQKAAYFLQTLLGIPAEYKFLFYKHGPFSFDLHDELISVRADNLVDLASKPAPYGPKWELTVQGRSFRDSFLSNVEESRAKAEIVAERFGNKGVAELERLSAALYVSIDSWAKSAQERANLLHDLKPHVSVSTALEAVNTIDQLHSELS